MGSLLWTLEPQHLQASLKVAETMMWSQSCEAVRPGVTRLNSPVQLPSGRAAVPILPRHFPSALLGSYRMPAERGASKGLQGQTPVHKHSEWSPNSISPRGSPPPHSSPACFGNKWAAKPSRQAPPAASLPRLLSSSLAHRCRILGAASGPRLSSGFRNQPS